MSYLSPEAKEIVELTKSLRGKPITVIVAEALRVVEKRCQRTQEVNPDSWGRTITETVVDTVDLTEIADQLENQTTNI